MKQAHLVALVLLGLSTPAILTAAPQTTPRYSNAELVSINAQTRLVVVKNSDGGQETLQLDDNVAGLEGLRPGDSVMLSVRQEPGRSRISSITKSETRAAAKLANPAPARRTVVEGTTVAPSVQRFTDQVIAASLPAGRVDSLWNDFKTSCNVTVRSSYSDGRDWFSLWDGTAQMDVSGGSCRDLFNQVVGEGEKVKAAVAGAEEQARKADVAPGDLRDVLRRYSMEWGGWALPAPEPLKQ